MIPDVLNGLKTIFSQLWTALQLLIVPGTESLSFGTVLVAPFGIAVFSLALKKILDLSAHDGVSDVARNSYRRYTKEDKHD